MTTLAADHLRSNIFRRATRAAFVAAAAVGVAVVRRKRSDCDEYVVLSVDRALSFDESVLDDIDWANQPNVTARELELLRAAAGDGGGRVDEPAPELALN